MKKWQNILYITLLIYLLCSILTITSFCLDNHTIVLFLRITRYIVYMVFLCNIIKEYKRITIIDLIIILIGLAIMLIAKNNNVLIVVLILISCKNLDVDKIFQYTYFLYGVLFFTIVILSILGIIPDWTFFRGSIERHSLGFMYPTDCYSIFLVFVLLLFYNSKKNISYYKIIILFFVNIVLYVLTNGRLSFILINLVLLLIILSNSKNALSIIKHTIISKSMKINAILFPFLLFFITIILVIMYKNNNFIAVKINDILSDRLKYSSNAISDYPITLFGQKIKWYGWGGYGYTNISSNFKYNFVDNSYIRMLLDYGIVGTFAVLLSYSKLLLYCVEEKKGVLYTIIIIVLIWSFVEPYIFVLYRNIFIITFLLLLKERKLKKG